MGGKIIESTFMLVLAYIVVSKAGGFSLAIGAFSSAYTSAVRTLQGR